MAAVMEPTAVWERLEASAQWATLSPQQRVWVLAWIASAGDGLKATKTAYRPASKDNLRAVAYQVAHHPNVIAALDIVRGDEHVTEPVTREMLIHDVQIAIRKAEPGSVAHSRLLAQLERLTMPYSKAEAEPEPEAKADQDLVEVAETPKPKFVVGQRIQQRDQHGILHYGVIQTIDGNGQPLDIVEVSEP